MTAADATTHRGGAAATSADAATATGAGAGVSPPAGSTARPSSRPSPGRLAGWVVLAVVLLGALAFGTHDDGGARTPDERARNLAESIACPRCDGQSVADSDADAAKGIRSVIERRIDEGWSDAEIRDDFAASYGERVLLTPGRSGVSSVVWTLPVVVVIVAFAGLAFAFRRWRGGGGACASDADRDLVARARAGAPAADPEATGVAPADGHRGGDDDGRVTDGSP